MELHQWRGFQDGQPKPLDFLAMEAWARVTGRELSPIVLNIFGLLERTFFVVETGKSDVAETQDISEKLKANFRSMMSDKDFKTAK
jgi:hypothetical protein